METIKYIVKIIMKIFQPNIIPSIVKTDIDISNHRLLTIINKNLI
jgi:hypothetical protein